MSESFPPAPRNARRDAWSPHVLSSRLPGIVAASSETQGNYDGLLVERRGQEPAEVRIAPLLAAHLVFHLHGPMRLREETEGSGVREVAHLPGAFKILPPGIGQRRSHWDGPIEVLHLHFTPGWLEAFAQREAIGGKRRPLELIYGIGVEDAPLAALGRTFAAELAVGCPGGKLFGDALATALAAALLRRHVAFPVVTAPNGKQGLGDMALRRVQEYVQEHLAADLSLADMARVAGISPYHFARLFRQSTGRSPYRYLIEQRIARAQALLRDSRLSVADVAVRVGFYDHSHLSRHFKRVTGATPRAG
jgi:AraC family transcriptional regulator